VTKMSDIPILDEIFRCKNFIIIIIMMMFNNENPKLNK